MLSLGELLDHHDFGLRLLAGGEAALRRPVEGAHASETPNPSRFLPRGWVMLTLGLRLRNHVAEQRELVAELDDAGLCALGFGTGVAFKHVPPALVEAAEERGFPVFHIPFETPYREIAGFVNRSLLSTDFRLLHRSLSMQNHLMDALREEEPIAALVARLSDLLKSRVLIFARDGELEADSGEGPTDAIWAEVQQREPSLQRALVDESDLLSVPIHVAGHPDRLLVVASRRRAVPRQLASSVIQTTERLLEVITLSRHAAIAEERTLRAELLASALEPQAGYDRIELEARLERFGLSLARPTRVFALGPAPDARGGVPVEALDRARRALEELLEEAGAPYLMALREPRVLMLCEASGATMGAWIARLAAAGERLLAGGGRLVGSIEDVPQSWRDAELAFEQAVRRPAEPVLLFEDVDLANWLVSTVPPRTLDPKVAAVLGDLAAQPALYETLLAYLGAHTSISATAEALNLHPNSLRYRLGRIEEIVGRPLRELPVLVDLYLATLAHRGLCESPNGGAQIQTNLR